MPIPYEGERAWLFLYKNSVGVKILSWKKCRFDYKTYQKKLLRKPLKKYLLMATALQNQKNTSPNNPEI
jgi:hypothetical protein